MQIKLSKRFIKEFEKLPTKVKSLVIVILKKLETVDTLLGFPDCKRIQGYKEEYYRIRIANYRLGFEVVNNEIKAIHIMTISSRGDIYKTFPSK